MNPINNARVKAAANLHDGMVDAAEATTAFDTVHALAPAIDAIAAYTLQLLLDTCKDLGYHQGQDLLQTTLKKLDSPAPDKDP